MDITSIERYIEKPDNFMIAYVKHEINRLGITRFLEISIKALDASKVWDDGLRPIQTISYIYVRAVTEIVHTIQTYVDEDKKEYWLQILIDKHKLNIEFEKEHPPVDYDEGRQKSKSIKTSKVAESKTPRRKKDGMSAAERKLAEHVGKINALSIKLKK